ncbi:MAG: hypothetical protein HKN25_04375 [Pyrinomonadaceae bacterium]|nr:hypothetical protein [Pyrinomonadaceae bacterium]
MTILIKELKAKLPDDARHFVDFPEVIFFDEFSNHMETLDGVEITEFEMDGTIEMWLEFGFRKHRFFVNNRFGDYWFFVEDPKCPEEILLEIAEHFRKLLEKDESLGA